LTTVFPGPSGPNGLVRDMELRRPLGRSRTVRAPAPFLVAGEAAAEAKFPAYERKTISGSGECVMGGGPIQPDG